MGCHNWTGFAWLPACIGTEQTGYARVAPFAHRGFQPRSGRSRRPVNTKVTFQ
jgi:hypothetical protein